MLVILQIDHYIAIFTATLELSAAALLLQLHSLSMPVEYSSLRLIVLLVTCNKIELWVGHSPCFRYRTLGNCMLMCLNSRCVSLFTTEGTLMFQGNHFYPFSSLKKLQH